MALVSGTDGQEKSPLAQKPAQFRYGVARYGGVGFRINRKTINADVAKKPFSQGFLASLANLLGVPCIVAAGWIFRGRFPAYLIFAPLSQKQNAIN